MKRSVTFLFLFLFNGIFAQKQSEHLIQSKVFGHERKISVYLPAVCLLDTVNDFPVAYLFDGQFEPYTRMVSGMMEYYNQTNFSLGFILVSIHTENRFEEFIPEPQTDAANNTTYKTRLTDFMEQEVFPFVDSNYRTTDFKLGIGHSLGGTFLLYEAFKENSPFGAIIAASPNTNLNQMTKMIPDYLKKAPEMTTFFYVTGGDTDQMELDFLKTTMQIDSAIKARNAVYPDWNFHQYTHSNHMETFPKTFNDGFLLFSERWGFSEKDLAAMTDLQDAALEKELRACLKRKSITRKTELPYNFRNVLQIQNTAELKMNHQAAFNVSTLALQVLETDSTVSMEDKEKVRPQFTEKRKFYQFSMLCNQALDASNRKDYRSAAEDYMKAFKMDILRGTFYERLNSLGSLTQSGNTEEAFKQIELLANHFKLVGSSSLTDNPLLEPLHKDKRWNKYLRILDENAKNPME